MKNKRFRKSFKLGMSISDVIEKEFSDLAGGLTLVSFQVSSANRGLIRFEKII